MLYLGLILCVVSYCFLVGTILIYTSLVIKKKWNSAITFEMFTFATSLIIATITTWSIIIMNESYNVNFKINISYVPFIFAAVSLVLLVINSNIINPYRENKSVLSAIANFLMPAFTLIAVLISTYALSYDVSYFYYLMV